jgi:glycosyltransferase involved in cell wall biosynthesis
VKISIIAPTFLPSRRANTFQVMKMAQALTELEHDVIVFVPKLETDQIQPSWGELSQHYGLRRQFNIEWLVKYSSLRGYDYGLTAVKHAQQWGSDLIYTRLPQAAAFASMLGMACIYEIHDYPHRRTGSWLLRFFLRGKGARALVVITEALLKEVASNFDMVQCGSSGKSVPVTIAPDGVDLFRYQNFSTPEQARETLSYPGLRSSIFTAGYTGHLYPGRGSDLILKIAEHLPDMVFLIAGGEKNDLDRVQEKIHSAKLDNIILTGFIPNAKLPIYQAACDVLLMPYQSHVSASSGGDIAKYLSPMKLFEYMASGRAILSSDLPVLREILNTKNSMLLPPENVLSWVHAIKYLRNNTKERIELGEVALQDVRKYSWQSRASKILQTAQITTKKN